jgi:hypothetical protein
MACEREAGEITAKLLKLGQEERALTDEQFLRDQPMNTNPHHSYQIDRTIKKGFNLLGFIAACVTFWVVIAPCMWAPIIIIGVTGIGRSGNKVGEVIALVLILCGPLVALFLSRVAYKVVSAVGDDSE